MDVQASPDEWPERKASFRCAFGAQRVRKPWSGT